jgi:hypothetical protein
VDIGNAETKSWLDIISRQWKTKEKTERGKMEKENNYKKYERLNAN